MQSQDKLQDTGGSKSPASVAPAPSPTSRGFAGFFRRRRKSTSSNHDDSSDVESMDNQDNMRSKTSQADGHKDKDVYGNYATVSGTGANLMRDLFNRKYRASARLSANFSSSNDAESRRKSNQSGSNASSLASLFKFRSKKDTIKEERSPSPTTPEAEDKSKRDHSRSRHISIGSEAAARKFVTPSSSKLGSIMSSNKVRGFFDSFRQKTPRETTPEAGGSLSPSSQLVPQLSLGPTIVYAPGKKKKKFKVTRAIEDDPTQFGPNHFLEMYRKNRAESDLKRFNRMHQVGKCCFVNGFKVWFAKFLIAIFISWFINDNKFIQIIRDVLLCVTDLDMSLKIILSCDYLCLTHVLIE